MNPLFGGYSALSRAGTESRETTLNNLADYRVGTAYVPIA